MTWFDSIDQYAKQTGREVISLPNGRAIRFKDGFDFCWLLTGDVLSTLPAPADRATALQTIAEFERIDRVRSDVLHVLRHYLASKKYAVSFNPSGEWTIQSSDGIESSLRVGAYLSSLVRDGNDLASCLAKLLKGSVIRHPPSALRTQKYLNTPGDPSGERATQDDPVTPVGDSMASILDLMDLRRAADPIPDQPTPPDTKNPVTRHDAIGPLVQALLRVGQRLPAVKPSFNLWNKTITLGFPDGLDGIDLNVKSRQLRRSIQKHGPAVTADLIADDFERLTRLRAITLAAIDVAATSIGWTIDEMGTTLLWPSTLWHIGPDIRIHTIEVGPPLTEALRQSTPELFFKKLALDSTDKFPAACVDALTKLGDHPPPAWRAPRARLAPPLPLALPTLFDPTDPALIEQTDRWAADTLHALKHSDNFWSELESPIIFDPAVDTWLTQRELVSMAATVPEDSWVYPRALRILLEGRHEAAPQKVRELIQRSEEFLIAGGTHDATDDLIALLWMFRAEFPDLPKKYFAPQPHSDVPHAEARAKAGDPIARQYLATQQPPSADHELPFWMEVIPPSLRHLPQHARLLEWAKREWRWSDCEPDPLELAIQAQWPELADALDTNPYIVTTLLTHEPRGSDGHDGPGLLRSDKLLLAWSRLKPTPLLAKLIVTALNTDLVSQAQHAETAAAQRNPQIDPNFLPLAHNAMSIWWQNIQPPLAIAWTRWRNRPAKTR